MNLEDTMSNLRQQVGTDILYLGIFKTDINYLDK